MNTSLIFTVDKYFLLANYGSFLQHYALRKVLRDFGLSSHRLARSGEIATRSQMFIESLKVLLRPLYWRLISFPDRERHLRGMKQRDKMYWLFRNDYESLISPFAERIDLSQVDIAIRGGDQVFAPDDSRYWFSELNPKVKRITYAASWDWESASRDQCWMARMKEVLRGFSFVGVRESRGVELAKLVAPKESAVVHVADPVQLLTVPDLRAIQSHKPMLEKPTLFCYLVNIRSSEDINLCKYQKLAVMLGCDLVFVGVQGAERFIPKKYRAIYSPRQFLRALDDCKFFITNSYHGSVLAIQYQKSFLSIWQNCLPGTNQNERQKELMHKFGIKDRWVDYTLSAEEWKSLLETPLDWSRINREAEEWRSASLEWLKKAIGEDK